MSLSARLLVTLASSALVLMAACDPESGDATDPRHPGADWFTLETGEFTIEPGTERYLCWSQTLTEDLYIDHFDYASVPVVHHLFMQRAEVPEPEGFSECDVLFKPTWRPLFGAATDDAEVVYPEGAVQRLPAGTQVVVQLHLLNPRPTPVTTTARIWMHKSANGQGAEPVGWTTFGSERLYLPPGQQTTIQTTCEIDRDTVGFAGGPHMHQLGVSATLEVGPDEDSLTVVHSRDPYDFDRQTIDPLPLTLEKGDLVRLTCNFDNHLDTAVSFGESSNDEMCYFVLFSVGFEGLRKCTPLGETVTDPSALVPPDPAAGICGEQVPNPLGVGMPCSLGGGECPSGFACSADNAPEGDLTPPFCVKLGCDTDDACGGGWATCCAPPEAGGLLNVCLPEACRPASCTPMGR